MIIAKNNATVVVLKMASTGIVMSFLQHKNGGLSQGDDSSATEILEDIKATISQKMKQVQAVVAPIVQIEALLKKEPYISNSMPRDLKAKLNEARSRTTEMEQLHKNMADDIAEIDKLLQFSRLFDAGNDAQLPEGLSQEEALIEDLLSKIFPQAENAGSEDYTPSVGDMIVGCGEPGCEGCGGRKVFQFDENEPFAGLLSLGTLKVPAQTNPTRGDLPEELKAIFGDDVHVIKIGGQRETDPLRGLAELLQKALNTKQ